MGSVFASLQAPVCTCQFNPETGYRLDLVCPRHDGDYCLHRPRGQDVPVSPDVDAAVEQAFNNLYARLDAIAPLKVPPQGEQQALAIIKTLGQELKDASHTLEKVAEIFKMQPNLGASARLRLANSTINAARRAREAAESVLG